MFTVKASELLFGKSSLSDFEKCDELTLSYVFADIPTIQISRSEFEEKSISDLGAALLSSSKAEIKRLMNGGGRVIKYLC